MKKRNYIIMSIILGICSVCSLIEGQVNENIKRFDVLKKAPPDLVALSMKVFAQDGGGLLSGKNTGVSCKFKNSGGAFINEYLINIYMDGNLIVDGGKAIAGMVGWGVDWIATAGTHTARCVLDTQNVIKESNEANNEIAYVFTVQRAFSVPVTTVPPILTTDISIEKIEVKAEDGKVVTPGKASRVYCYWKRTGTKPATTFRVNVKMDGTSIGAGTVDQTLTSNWLAGPWIATAGRHHIFCEVDYENAVVESNEMNNKRTQIYNLPGIRVHSPLN